MGRSTSGEDGGERRAQSGRRSVSDRTQPPGSKVRVAAQPQGPQHPRHWRARPGTGPGPAHRGRDRVPPGRMACGPTWPGSPRTPPTSPRPVPLPDPDSLPEGGPCPLRRHRRPPRGRDVHGHRPPGGSAPTPGPPGSCSSAPGSRHLPALGQLRQMLREQTGPTGPAVVILSQDDGSGDPTDDADIHDLVLARRPARGPDDRVSRADAGRARAQRVGGAWLRRDPRARRRRSRRTGPGRRGRGRGRSWRAKVNAHGGLGAAYTLPQDTPAEDIWEPVT